jgi:hypothetical protein
MRWFVFSSLLGSFVHIQFFKNSIDGALGEPCSVLLQSAEYGEVLAFKSALEAGEDVQRAGVIAQRTECAREQGDRGFFRAERFQTADFTVEHRRLQFPEAGLTPVCDGHHSDQVVLDGGTGRKITLEDGELSGEIGLGCGVGEEGLGTQAVTMLLREELALPMAVTGPRDLAPLARAAAARFSLVTRLEIVGSDFIWPYCALWFSRLLAGRRTLESVFSGLAAKIIAESV